MSIVRLILALLVSVGFYSNASAGDFNWQCALVRNARATVIPTFVSEEPRKKFVKGAISGHLFGPGKDTYLVIRGYKYDAGVVDGDEFFLITGQLTKGNELPQSAFSTLFAAQGATTWINQGHTWTAMESNVFSRRKADSEIQMEMQFGFEMKLQDAHDQRRSYRIRVKGNLTPKLLTDLDQTVKSLTRKEINDKKKVLTTITELKLRTFRKRVEGFSDCEIEMTRF
jgi:hypothetical protein